MPKDAHTFVGVDILRSDRETNGALTVQLGDVVSEEQTSSIAQWWQHVGFASRPSKPTKGKSAAQAVVISRSQGDAVVASRDARGFALYGSLEEGETVVYASKGQAKILLKENGAITAFTTDNNETSGTAIQAEISPEKGFLFSSKWGIISLGPDGLLISVQKDGVGKAFIKIEPDTGNVQVVSGTGTVWNRAATVLLGAAPLPEFAAAYSIGGAATPSTNVFLTK